MPFNQVLEIPPLPTLTTTVLNDPNDRNRGEKLITKTFFSIGGADSEFLSKKERKVVASLFRQQPDGTLEHEGEAPVAPPLPPDP